MQGNILPYYILTPWVKPGAHIAHQKVVVLHIKLKGTERRTQYFTLTHTADPYESLSARIEDLALRL